MLEHCCMFVFTNNLTYRQSVYNKHHTVLNIHSFIFILHKLYFIILTIFTLQLGSHWLDKTLMAH